MDSARHNSIYPYRTGIRRKVERVILEKEGRMTDEERKLLQEIEETYKEMATTWNHFEYAIDPELIEYYTYQYKAAEIKHGYLMRCIKKLYLNK